MANQNHDVIVAGAGPAGIAAAIAAARAGAHTLLLEKNPFAGGTWTAGSVSLVIDDDNKSGIMLEIGQRLKALGAWERWEGWANAFTVESMKLLLDEMLLEAGVEIRFHTLLVDAEVEDRRIQRILTASKSGLEYFSAPVFVDATGDGDLAARAGCAFDLGREGDGKCQPGSMFALVGGLPVPPTDGQEIKRVLLANSFNPTYYGVTVFPQPGQPGAFFLALSHVYGVDATNAVSLTQGEMAGRRDVNSAVKVLRSSGDPRFKDVFVIYSGPFLGIRESRRIHGLYTLTVDDCRAGRTFADGICQVTFNVDVHHVSVEDGRRLDAEPVLPYQIPYRSLVAADVDNLLLSGRCISGDFLAHSSYRVTGNAVATGEAVGRAAAITVQEGIAPSRVDASRLSLLP